MANQDCERAIAEALEAGKAMLKFISANDVGLTGSHQRGFYLPKGVWPLFTTLPPVQGENGTEEVEIIWPDGRRTGSNVKWYGRGSRSEYRLTRFGPGFPYLSPERVGDLLVLVLTAPCRFVAFVLSDGEDIEEVQAALGTATFQSWGAYDKDQPTTLPYAECEKREIEAFGSGCDRFPASDEFSDEAWRILTLCDPDFSNANDDETLMRCVETEYAIFRAVEERQCKPAIERGFATVEEFVKVALTIMNRRKARAGRSFENHIHKILRRAGIPHAMRARVDGNPDVLIPSEAAYLDPGFPADALCVLGIKTTCKDRWRQVVQEGKRASKRYLVTLQPGISAGQLSEMASCGIRLVVPQQLHGAYPPKTPMKLMTLHGLVSALERQFGSCSKPPSTTMHACKNLSWRFRRS